MPWMIHQRYASAIREAYRSDGRAEVIEEQLGQARQARAWLESLDIEPGLRASLVEPIAAVEESFEELLRAAITGT